MAKRSSDKKSANGLVALGSAAVLAVYSAGFFKTKAAAERLEALESRVRPNMTTGAAAPAAQPPAAPAPAAIESARVEQPSESAPVEKAPAPKMAPAMPAAPQQVEEKTAVVEAQTPAPAVVEAPPAEEKHEVKVETAAAPAVAPPPPAPAPAAPVWKDGTFTGWGSARHGSIQASVVVAAGKITSAKIEQCQMRYSCSLLDKLVPEVADRGTPELIDYVSGATESSNVFYWAVTDALSKAK